MEVLSIVIPYLLGSIPSAYIIGSFRKVDVTKEGSCNVGAANVFDLIGFKAAFLTLIMDMGKGYLAAFLGHYFFGTITASFCFGFFALVGHSWSIFLKGCGGKGLATTAGVILFTGPYLLIPLLAILLLINGITSSMTISIVGSALVFPLLAYCFHAQTGLIFALLVVLLVIINLRKDIKAVIEKKEGKNNIILKLFKRGKR